MVTFGLLSLFKLFLSELNALMWCLLLRWSAWETTYCVSITLAFREKVVGVPTNPVRNQNNKEQHWKKVIEKISMYANNASNPSIEIKTISDPFIKKEKY